MIGRTFASEMNCYLEKNHLVKLLLNKRIVTTGKK